MNDPIMVNETKYDTEQLKAFVIKCAEIGGWRKYPVVIEVKYFAPSRRPTADDRFNSKISPSYTFKHHSSGYHNTLKIGLAHPSKTVGDSALEKLAFLDYDDYFAVAWTTLAEWASILVPRGHYWDGYSPEYLLGRSWSDPRRVTIYDHAPKKFEWLKTFPLEFRIKRTKKNEDLPAIRLLAKKAIEAQMAAADAENAVQRLKDLKERIAPAEEWIVSTAKAQKSSAETFVKMREYLESEGVVF